MVERGSVSLNRGDDQSDVISPKRTQMTPIANSDKTSVKALQASITMLTKQDRRWRKTGSKRALYRYLTMTFDLYTGWKRVGDARSVANRMVKRAGLGHQPDRHPLRIIIDATSLADRKSKSRWTQALRFAWRERSKWSDLTSCLHANGGVAGCASKWADLQAEHRTPPGFVRVGGDNRFPRVPLFVAASLLDRYGDYR
jgi:hypothetical protein